MFLFGIILKEIVAALHRIYLNVRFTCLNTYVIMKPILTVYSFVKNFMSVLILAYKWSLFSKGQTAHRVSILNRDSIVQNLPTSSLQSDNRYIHVWRCYCSPTGTSTRCWVTSSGPTVTTWPSSSTGPRGWGRRRRASSSRSYSTSSRTSSTTSLRSWYTFQFQHDSLFFVLTNPH